MTHIAFAPDVVLQMIDNEALLLKLQDEVVFSLNATGARIAQLIVDGLSLDEVVTTLCREHGMSRIDVEPDVQDLVSALMSKGLVIRTGAKSLDDRD